MSTNYFLRKANGDIHHLGQTAIGWKFLFAADPDRGVIDSRSWSSQFENGDRVFNEYGDELQDIEEMFEIVELRRDNVTLKSRPYHSNPNGPYPDSEGNAFQSGWFR